MVLVSVLYPSENRADRSVRRARVQPARSSGPSNETLLSQASTIQDDVSEPSASSEGYHRLISRCTVEGLRSCGETERGKMIIGIASSTINCSPR